MHGWVIGLNFDCGIVVDGNGLNFDSGLLLMVMLRMTGWIEIWPYSVDHNGCFLYGRG